MELYLDKLKYDKLAADALKNLNLRESMKQTILCNNDSTSYISMIPQKLLHNTLMLNGFTMGLLDCRECGACITDDPKFIYCMECESCRKKKYDRFVSYFRYTT